MTANNADDRTLTDWAHRVSQALQILDLKVDQQGIHELSTRSDAAVAPGAGGISVFLAGYAAGLATAPGRKAAQDAVEGTFATVKKLCDDGTAPGHDGGWAASGQ